MKKLLVVALICLPVHVVAQPLPAEIVLKVTPDELGLIEGGLHTQPFGKVLPLINKLREQVMSQQKKPEEPAKPADKPNEPSKP